MDEMTCEELNFSSGPQSVDVDTADVERFFGPEDEMQRKIIFNMENAMRASIAAYNRDQIRMNEMDEQQVASHIAAEENGAGEDANETTNEQLEGDSE